MMKFSNSYEVIAKIEQKKRNGIALRQLKQFMASIGNPQNQLQCIHIGGTNGKGSTCNAIAHILMDAGYRVGMFTSPYLETHHDRIRINDVFIDDQSIVDYANIYYEQWVNYDLSMFEIDMFIATQYFVDHKVDFAIFEVGLGGEQDATNIITPLVSAITNIGMDHMEYLGNDYVSIAAAKAGIIKEKVPFLTMETKQECCSLLKKRCEEKGAPFSIVEKPSGVRVDDCLHFDFRSYQDVRQPTLASYQAENSALAIAIVETLIENKKVKVNEAQIRAGIQASLWKGRFEKIRENPLVVIDGAHNNEGMDALVKACAPFSTIHVLYTALKDKPNHEMLEKLLCISEDVTVTEFDFYRAEKAEIIAGDCKVKMEKDYQKAIHEIMQRTKENELFLICGSLYFISQVRAYLK